MLDKLPIVPLLATVFVVALVTLSSLSVGDYAEKKDPKSAGFAVFFGLSAIISGMILAAIPLQHALMEILKK